MPHISPNRARYGATILSTDQSVKHRKCGVQHWVSKTNQNQERTTVMPCRRVKHWQPVVRGEGRGKLESIKSWKPLRYKHKNRSPLGVWTSGGCGLDWQGWDWGWTWRVGAHDGRGCGAPGGYCTWDRAWSCATRVHLVARERSVSSPGNS